MYPSSDHVSPRTPWQPRTVHPFCPSAHAPLPSGSQESPVEEALMGSSRARARCPHAVPSLKGSGQTVIC